MTSRNIRVTTDISVEKTIYNQSFKFEISITKISTIVNMTITQKQLQQMIDATMNNYVQRHSFQSKSIESRDSSNLDEHDAIENNDSQSSK